MLIYSFYLMILRYKQWIKFLKLLNNNLLAYLLFQLFYNLKRIFIICIVSLYISSCTDIITENDLEMIDNIENTEVTTETAAFINDDEDYEDNSGKGN